MIQKMYSLTYFGYVDGIVVDIPVEIIGAKITSRLNLRMTSL